MRGPLPLLALLLLLAAVPAAGRGTPQAELDGAVAAGAVGVQGCVVVKGRVEWQGAAGLADPKTGRKVTVDTPFRIGSCTKTMVATAALQLVDRGSLDLEAPVGRYLSPDVTRGFPNLGRVTVRRLLDHTSGLEDYLDDRFYQEAEAHPTREWTDLEALRFARGLDPVGPPGGGHSYSNTNYLLLGLVMAKAGGQPVGVQLRERIFRPLGMKSASYGPFRSAPRDVAHGVDAEGRDWGRINQGDNVADGGVIATARDMALFMDGLMRGRLLKPATLKAMKTTVPDGEGGGYGLGLARSEEEGVVSFGHEGALVGYLAAMAWYPASGAAVAAATNGSAAEGEEAFDGLVDRLAQATGGR